HALRAFTPNDVDALRKTVNTYPKSDFYAIDKVLTSLGTGQALITVLNEKGIPTEVAATLLTSPRAVMGPMANIDCEKLMQASPLYTKYHETKDPISAYELLTDRINEQMAAEHEVQAKVEEQKKIVQESKQKHGEKGIVEQIM